VLLLGEAKNHQKAVSISMLVQIYKRSAFWHSTQASSSVNAALAYWPANSQQLIFFNQSLLYFAFF